MEPLESKNVRKILLGNIALVLIKTIAYLVVIVLSILMGLGLMATLLPETSMAAMTSTDFYDWENLNYQYLGQLIGVLLSTLAFRYVVDKKDYRSIGLGLNHFGSYLGEGILWAVGILSVAFLLIWMNGNIQILGTQNLGVALLGYLSFFLLVSLVEEVICRGYLLNMVTEHLNYKVGIAVSAIIFTLAHIGNNHFSWIAFCNLTLGGILMSLLYLKHQSLYVPIGFHWIWNYFQGNILGFGVSGTDVLGILQIQIDGPDWLTGGYFGLEGSLITCLLLAIAIYSLWTGSKDQLDRIDSEKNISVLNTY